MEFAAAIIVFLIPLEVSHQQDVTGREKLPSGG